MSFVTVSELLVCQSPFYLLMHFRCVCAFFMLVDFWCVTDLFSSKYTFDVCALLGDHNLIGFFLVGYVQGDYIWTIGHMHRLCHVVSLSLEWVSSCYVFKYTAFFAGPSLF